MQKTRVQWNAAGPLVGRRRAVTALRDALNSARRGEPAVVLLEGGPGIGKSRLIQEARRIAGPDATFVSGRFLASSPRPLAPIIDAVLPALRDARMLEESELGAHATVLRDLVRGRFPRRQEWLQSTGDRLKPALLTAVERWVSRDTITFAFDDVQWADGTSVDALEHLLLGVLDAAGRRGQHATFILASQDVSEGPVARLLTRLRSQPATVSLHLEGLSEIEMASLIRHGTGLQCPPQLLRRVADATGGNPLIALELFRQQATVTSEGLSLPTEVRIPRTALETARAALHSMEPGMRKTLAVASQWHGSFDAEDIAAVLGDDPVRIDADLDAALRRDLLAGADGGYEFAVPTMREAAALEAGRAESARWNLTIAVRLREQGQPDPARVARHVLAAGQLCARDERRSAFLAAANASFAQRAYADAALWYERGLPPDEELSPGEATAELLLRCATAHQRNMDVPVSERRFRQALEWCRDCGDTEGWGHALMGLMRAAMAHGQVPTDRHPYEEEYRAFLQDAADDGATVAAVMASWANGLHFVRSLETADVAHAALAKAHESGSLFAEVLARVALGLHALDEMDGTEAAYQNERAVEVARRMDDPWFQCWGLQNLAPSLVRLGRISDALGVLEQTRAAARHAGNTAAAGFAAACAVAIAASSGDFAGGEVAADEGLAMLDRSSNAQIAWTLLPALAAMRTWQGDFPGARAAVGRLSDYSPPVASAVETYVNALAGTLAEHGLRMPAAGPTLDVVRLFNVALRIDALIWREELEPAPAVRAALQELVERGMRFTQSPCFSLQRLIAELLSAEGDRDAAESNFLAAIESCQSNGLLLETSRCHLGRARHLLEEGRHETVEDSIRVAWTIAGECGAASIAEQCATLAQRAGIDDYEEGSGEDRIAGVRSLDVLVEWAHGKDVGTIAETLISDAATVEAQLAQARSTYSVSTRAEATEMLERLGLGTRGDAPQAMSSVFLFTDIVDSTPANVRLGDRLWAEIVGLHDAQIRESVDRHGGRVIKTIGDGTFAAFDSIADAVGAAAEIRARPPLQVPGHPDVRLLDRIGIHAGSAVPIEGDFLGLAVTVTSRLCGIARGKQILLSEPVRRGLPPDLASAVVDRGRVGLKGLAGRMRVFELAPALA